jgi:hypothetical protein
MDHAQITTTDANTLTRRPSRLELREGTRGEKPKEMSDAIHRSLRESAEAARVADSLWEGTDLVALWESFEQRRAERAA